MTASNDWSVVSSAPALMRSTPQTASILDPDNDEAVKHRDPYLPTLALARTLTLTP